MNSLKSTTNKASQQKQQQQSTGGLPGSSKTTDSLPATVDSSSSDGGDRCRGVLRTGRSNSVDMANLSATAAMAVATAAGNTTRNWFRKISIRAAAAATAATTTVTTATVSAANCTRSTVAECAEQRPVTIGGDGEYVVQKSPVVVTFADERPKVSLLEPMASKPEKQPVHPSPASPRPLSISTSDKKPVSDVVLWDRPTGSMVNAEVLGTAIEGFLSAKKSGDSGETSPANDCVQLSSGKPTVVTDEKTTSEQPNSRTCDTSICSSLKDLFVK